METALEAVEQKGSECSRRQKKPDDCVLTSHIQSLRDSPTGTFFISAPWDQSANCQAKTHAEQSWLVANHKE